MAKIKVLLATGIPLPLAVKASLGISIQDFAAKHAVPAAWVSNVINGSTPYPLERVRVALAEELGVEREWLDPLLDAQREEKATVAA